MLALRSSESLIQALRAPEAPSDPKSPSKIHIARAAWDTTDLYIPSKSQLLVEWILNALLKDKEGNRGSHLFDYEYWNLFADILCQPHKMPPPHEPPAWLVSLMGRIPFVSIVTSFFNLASISCNDISNATASAFLLSVQCLWDHAAGRVPLEALAECFYACIKFQSSSNLLWGNEPTRPAILSLDQAVEAVVNTFAATFVKLSSSKKVQATFIQGCSREWLILSWANVAEASKVLPGREAIRKAGLDIVTSLDMHKQPLEVQKTNANSLLATLRSLSTHNRDVLSHAIPDMLSHWVQSLAHHHASQAAQSGNTTSTLQLARQAIKSFLQLFPDTLGAQRDTPYWNMWSKILRFLDGESLYDNDDLFVFRALIENCCNDLSEPQATENSSAAMTAVLLQCLSALSKVDPDAVKSHFDVVAAAVADFQVTKESTAFLNLWLLHHERTRAMHEFTISLINSLTASRCRNQDPVLRRRDLLTGPCLQPTFQKSWMQSLNLYLTPLKIHPLLQDLLSIVAGCLLKLTATVAGQVSIQDLNHSGCEFSVVTGTILTIISSFPWSRLPSDSVGSAKHLLNSAMENLRASKLDGTKSGYQIAAAAIQRWYHTFEESRVLQMFDVRPPPLQPSLVEKVLMSKAGTAELAFEVGRRTLCLRSADGRSLDHLLTYLEAHLSTSSHWDGSFSEFSSQPHGHSSAAIGLWKYFLETSLMRIQEFMSQSQSERLVQLIIRQCSGTQQSTHSTAASFTARAISSANFWQVHRISDCLISTLADVISTVRASVMDSKDVTSEQVIECLSAFGILYVVPIECINRHTKLKLFNAAIFVDQHARTISVLELSDKVKAQAELRNFARSLKSSLLDNVICESDLQCLKYIVTSSSDDQHPSLAYRRATRDLVNVIILSFQATNDHLVKTVWCFQALVTRMHNESWKMATALEMDLLRDFINNCRLRHPQPQAYPSSFLTLASGVLQNISSNSDPKMATNLDAGRDHQVAAILLCCSIVQFLSNESASGAFAAMLNAFLQERSWWEELLYQQDPAWRHAVLDMLRTIASQTSSMQGIKAITAILIVIHRSTSAPESNGVVEIFRSLSAEAYSQVLELILDGIGDTACTVEDWKSLVRMSETSLRKFPSVLTSSTYTNIRSTLKLIAYQIQLPHRRKAQEECLTWLATICSEQASSVREIDLGNIWHIISDCLHGSAEHEGRTIQNQFHLIVGTCSNIVRLRRDLILASIPQLVTVIRRLISVMAQPQPQLGAKQLQLVADGLPWWICIAEPLGILEARALSRFLTSLLTKSTVRYPRESTKAESMSRHLAMHAPYILTAYTSLLNDPLLTISRSLRQELEPGLYSLCEMSSTHARDAVMVALGDAGEKAILKQLWQGFEKQRYAGEG